MRHRMKSVRLSRNTSARKALLRSLAANIINHYRIKTSLAKAKEARRVIERLITLGKADTLHARRKAYKVLNDRAGVKRLFTEIAPLFKQRAGGYTRIIRAYPRRGDGAEMVFLELTEQPVKEVKKINKKKSEEKEAAKPEKRVDKKGEPEKKVAPPPVHEKKALEPRKEERPTKRPPKKSFFKNLRQHFKRKSMD